MKIIDDNTRSEYDANLFLSESKNYLFLDKNDREREEYIAAFIEENDKSLTKIVYWIVACMIVGLCLGWFV